MARPYLSNDQETNSASTVLSDRANRATNPEVPTDSEAPTISVSAENAPVQATAAPTVSEDTPTSTLADTSSEFDAATTPFVQDEVMAEPELPQGLLEDEELSASADVKAAIEEGPQGDEEQVTYWTGEKGIKWDGWKENSMTAHAMQYFDKINDPAYDGPESVESKTAEIAEATMKFQELQDKYSDKPKMQKMLARKQKALMKKNQELKALELKEGAAEVDVDLMDVGKQIWNNPESFAKDVVQGIVDAPDAILLDVGITAAVMGAAGSVVPGVGTSVGGVGGAMVGFLKGTISQGVKTYMRVKNTIKRQKYMSSKAVTMSASLVARGGMAYGGVRVTEGLALALKDAAETGEFDLMKGVADSHDEAVIGVILGGTIAGGAKLAIKGGKAANRKLKQMKRYDDHIETLDEANFAKASAKEAEFNKAAQLKDDIREAQARDEGVVYVSEFGEVRVTKVVADQAESTKLAPEELKVLNKEAKGKLGAKDSKALGQNIRLQRKVVDDLKEEELDLNAELEATPNDVELREMLSQVLESKDLEVNKLAKLNDAKAAHKTGIQAFKALRERDAAIAIDAPNQMQFEGTNGKVQTFERYDPAKHNSHEVMHEGLDVADMSYTGRGFSKPNVMESTAQTMMSRILEKTSAGISNTVGRGLSPSMRRAGASPSLQHLHNLLDIDSTKPSTPFYRVPENIKYTQAKAEYEYNSATKSLSDVERKELTAALYGSMEATTPRVIAAATEITRQLAEDTVNLKAAGVVVNTMDNYIPRKYHTDRVKEDMGSAGAFGQLMQEKMGYNNNRVSEVYNEIITNENVRDGVLTSDTVNNSAAPFGERTLNDISNADLHRAGMLTEDLLPLIHAQRLNAARSIEMAKVYGHGGSKLKDTMNKATEELKANGHPALTKTEMNNLYDIYNVVNGTHGRIENKTLKHTQDYALAASTVASMGLSAFTSMSEILIGTGRLRGGVVKNTAKIAAGVARMPFQAVYDVSVKSAQFAVKSLPKHNIIREKVDGISEPELYKSARSFGATQDMVMELTVDKLNGDGMARAPSFVNEKFFIANGLRWLTKYQRSLAHQLAKEDTLEIIGRLANNNPSSFKAKQARRHLMELNIDPKAALKWCDEGYNVKDKAFMEKIGRGATRVVNDIIAEPNATNVPTYFNAQKWKWFTQFKSFGVSYTNTVLKRMYADVKNAKADGGSIRGLNEMMKKSYALTLTTAGIYYNGALKEFIGSGGEKTLADRDDEDVQKNIIKSGMALTGNYGLVDGLFQALDRRSVAEGVASFVSPVGSSTIKQVTRAKKDGVGGVVSGAVPVLNAEQRGNLADGVNDLIDDVLD